MQKKIAVVTGASKGVGKAVALHLSQKNYFVVLIARNNEILEQVKNEIIENGGSAAHFTLDISKAEDVKKTVSKIIKQYKKIDLLFNNAAILKRGTTDIADSEIEETININLNGAIYVAKYVAIEMKKQMSGYMINVSSSGGKEATSFAGVYNASKFGLIGYSEALTKEMSQFNVKVTCLCPSMIATDMASGRSLKNNEIIQVEDILITIDYLLSLSQNAFPVEITIKCLPFVAKLTKAFSDIYLKK
jgi:3-oxoacyl-[acyl-carrier protein] reductase